MRDYGVASDVVTLGFGEEAPQSDTGWYGDAATTDAEYDSAGCSCGLGAASGGGLAGVVVWGLVATLIRRRRSA